MYRLKKSLYGLKQAPREWYKKFDSFMISYGYTRTAPDHCVFTRNYSDDGFIILMLYVDDMLIIDHDPSKIDKLKRELNKSFAMKDLGHEKQILCIKISRERNMRSYGFLKKATLGRFLKDSIGAMPRKYALHLQVTSSLALDNVLQVRKMCLELLMHLWLAV